MSASPARASGSPDRPIVIAALIALLVLGWAYLLYWPMPMPDEAGHWAPGYLALTFVMWLLMMLAMMTPAVAPVVLLFRRVQQQQPDTAVSRTLAFVGGYFAAWAGFSIAATVLQSALISLEWIDTMTVAQDRALAAALIAAVGIYQFLPWKAACLEQCRSPLEFITRSHRRGAVGAWRMGLEHGAWCVGCCWLLMLLLFVGGTMHLAWIVGITVVVTLERWFAAQRWLSPALGVALIAFAAWWWLRP